MQLPASFPRFSRGTIALLLLIVALGSFLRIWPSAGFKKVGFDEHAYQLYVNVARTGGVFSYPDVVADYVRAQKEWTDAVVPATRIGFLWPASILAQLTGTDGIYALRAISAASSILLLLATAVIAYRFGGTERMLVLTSLMAFAPLQVYLGQRALIDGYFAFWAVLCAWFLWETLQAPRRKGWLIAYGVSLFVLVLTKENAAFVFVALMATLLVLYALRYNRPGWAVLIVSAVAPAMAVLILVTLVGGPMEWIEFYRMFSAKSRNLTYAANLQNGPWYRYLIDFTVISPCIVLLAAGRVFQIGKDAKADVFWALFLGWSFVFMSCVTNGMSARFATYWDEPLRWLAASQLILLGRRFTRVRPAVVTAVAVALLAMVDLAQYWRFFVHAKVYDPVSSHLLHALGLAN